MVKSVRGSLPVLRSRISDVTVCPRSAVVIAEPLASSQRLPPCKAGIEGTVKVALAARRLSAVLPLPFWSKVSVDTTVATLTGFPPAPPSSQGPEVLFPSCPDRPGWSLKIVAKQPFALAPASVCPSNTAERVSSLGEDVLPMRQPRGMLTPGQRAIAATRPEPR